MTRSLHLILNHIEMCKFTRTLLILHQIGDTNGHLVDDGAVELLDVSQDSDIFQGDKVDGNTLSAESTTSTDSVQVGFSVTQGTFNGTA